MINKAVFCIVIAVQESASPGDDTSLSDRFFLGLLYELNPVSTDHSNNSYSRATPVTPQRMELTYQIIPSPRAPRREDVSLSRKKL